MSTSSRVYGNMDSARSDLHVFVDPNRLLFSNSKRRNTLTLYNPHGDECQYRILTTNPARFDISSSKGTIKPSRRVDISIRLKENSDDDLANTAQDSEPIDYFRVVMQMGQLKGNRMVHAFWLSNLYDRMNADESLVQLLGEDSPCKLKGKIRLGAQLQHFPTTPSPPTSNFSNTRNSPINSDLPSRPSRSQTAQNKNNNPSAGSSNVNLVCTICAVACVTALFLPLCIDSDLCKKSRTIDSTQTSTPPGILTQLLNTFSVTYEMKLGCSFALGLFTYRLISTLPN